MSVTIIIIIITAVVSFSAFGNEELFAKLKFNPYMVAHRKEWHRFITHAFLHADWMHLLVNMYVFYIFGSSTEEIFSIALGTKGVIMYLLLYIGGILFAALPSFRKYKDLHHYNSVGASGAVAAVLFASIMFQPTSGIYFIFLPVRIPAFIFGILYLWYEHYMDKRSKDNVAHDAHFWGALFGVVYTLLAVPGSFRNFVIQVSDFIF